jgi:hypothetical protein
MEMKRVKVLRGSVEAPSGGNADFSPFSIRDGHAPDFVEALPGELVTLQADEAARLEASGAIEILP